MRKQIFFVFFLAVLLHINGLVGGRFRFSMHMKSLLCYSRRHCWKPESKSLINLNQMLQRHKKLIDFTIAQAIIDQKQKKKQIYYKKQQKIEQKNKKELDRKKKEVMNNFWKNQRYSHHTKKFNMRRI